MREAIADACALLRARVIGRGQVEAYNTAERDIHNLLNRWDSMTRTERRTRATIQEVVSTVENALELISIALTDAIPSSKQGEGGEGADVDGDGKPDE